MDDQQSGRADLSWVERLHTRLLVRYGGRWLKLWEHVADEDWPVQRQDWANELADISAAQIEWAMQHLPAMPPNASEFKALCLTKPYRQQTPLLDNTPLEADPTRTRALLEQAHQAMKNKPKGVEWAEALRAREEAGEQLTDMQQKAWRAALATRAPQKLPDDYRGMPEGTVPPWEAQP